MMAKKWLFITGTDTDVGKTVIATGFLAAANQAGLRTAAIKPIAAGCEADRAGHDQYRCTATAGRGQSSSCPINRLIPLP